MKILFAAVALILLLEAQPVLAQSNTGSSSASLDGRWNYVFDAGQATDDECGRILDGYLDVTGGKTKFFLYHLWDKFDYSGSFDKQNKLKGHTYGTWGEANVSITLVSNYGVGYFYFEGAVPCHGRIILEKGAKVSPEAWNFANKAALNRPEAEKRCVRAKFFPGSVAFDKCVAGKI